MEIELKYALENEQQYTAVLEFLNQKTAQTALLLKQENIFFDTENRDLRDSGLILRLRQENDVFWLTAKGASATEHLQDTILSTRLEEEIPVEPPQAQKLLAGQVDPLKLLEEENWPTEPQRQKERLIMLGALLKAKQKQSLKVIGRFNNLRRIYPIAINGASYKIECDETRFPGNRTDFEIEVELPNEQVAKVVREEIEKWLTSLQIPIATASGKASRFFACLKQN